MQLSSRFLAFSAAIFGTHLSHYIAVHGFAPPTPPLLMRTKTPISSRLHMSTVEETKVVSHMSMPTEGKLFVPPKLGVVDETEEQVLPFGADQVQKKEPVGDKGGTVEFIVLGTWMATLSAFLLINNYVGPWPQAIETVPVRYFGLTHSLSAMLFGGGVILTTLIEWLVVSSKNPDVLNFWFKKVPDLDSKIVLPALTGAIVSGVGLSVDHYDSLGESPAHIVAAISALLAFAGWWATTDLTTQGAASEAITEWTLGDTANTDVPRIAKLRRISNVVSCAFVAAIYAIMVLKPGYHP